MTDAIRIRHATEDERESLGLLKLRSTLAWGDFVDELSALPEARELRPELLPHTFVAEAANAAVGFATVMPVVDGEAELEELFVEPEWWRRGVGRRLVEHAVVMARAKGATSLHVVGNRRAGAFYEALGFEFVGEVETRFETALSMRLEVRVSSDEVAIRRAGVGDYQSIADVWLESARTILRETPPSPGQLRQRIEDETAAGWDLFVATKADRIIAMLAIKRKAAILDQLFVHPVEHRRGIGRMLLRHAQRIMPGGFTLRTASSNARARGFYERMGLTLAEEALHPTWGTPVCYYRWAPPTAS